MTSLLLELLVYPAICFLWKLREVVEGPATEGGVDPRPAATYS